MLDLSGAVWYNCTTSGRFFFFCKKYRFNAVLPYVVLCFPVASICGVRYDIWFSVMREASLFRGLFSRREGTKNISVKREVPLMRVKITLACTECKQRNYNTMKNKKNDPDRLEMNKYCRFCRKHTLHKETK